MGKSGSGAAKSYNYFGTLVGLIAQGPIDRIHAVIVDGKAIWEGDHSRPGSYVAADPAHPLNSVYDDLSGAIDSKWFVKLGNVRTGSLLIYWGTSTQTAPPALAGHPGYRGWAYLLAKEFLFGREKTTAPNIEVVVGRKPVIDGAIVLSADNTMDDGQVNPVACLAEILTSPHGAGLPVARLEAASWQAAATYAHLDPGLRYCSPLLAEAKDLRSICTELLALIDGAFAWTSDGQLALRLLSPGVNPGGLPTLDAALLTDSPKLAGAGWGDVPTAIITRYFDRERKFKEADHKVDHPVASILRGGETRVKSQDLPAVTRQNQAARWAAEILRRLHQPGVEVSLSVRPERITGIAPGSKVIVDIDPEPGGSGLGQLGVVKERKDSPTGPTTLRVVCDPLADAVPYSPTYEVPTPELTPADPLLHALAIPLPTALGLGPAVAVLATRPQADAVGYDVAFVWDRDGDGSIGDETAIPLGRGAGFACRLTLLGALSADDLAPQFALTDAVTGLDTYLADLLPESPLGASADRVLIVLANVDGAGRVATSAGEPIMEFLSVETRTPVGDNSHAYTVLRARLGLPARTWTTGCQAWLIPGTSLAPWRHPEMAILLRYGSAGVLRLATVTATAIAESLLEVSWIFPDSYDLAPRIEWLQPGSSLGVTDELGRYTLSAALSDWDGDLVGYEVLIQAEDGSVEVLEPRVPLVPTRGPSAPWTRTHTFPVGATKVVVIADDKAGNKTTSERIILRPSPGTIRPPLFNPPGADDLPLRAISVLLQATSPATKLEYAVYPIGVGAPSGAGTAAGMSIEVTIYPPRRLWARAGDSIGNWSAWVSADYSSVLSGGAGGGTGGLGIPGRINQQ